MTNTTETNTGKLCDLYHEVTKSSKTDQILEERWYYGMSVFHREDGPAHIRYNSQGEILKEIWYLHGKISRKDGPAYYIRDFDDIRTEIWYIDNEEHREDGPSHRAWDVTGKIIREEWRRYGKLYTEQSGDVVSRRLDGEKEVCTYVHRGMAHLSVKISDSDTQNTLRKPRTELLPSEQCNILFLCMVGIVVMWLGSFFRTYHTR